MYVAPGTRIGAAVGDHNAPLSSSRRYSASPVGSLIGSLLHGVRRFSREFALQLEHEPRSLTMQPASSFAITLHQGAGVS